MFPSVDEAKIGRTWRWRTWRQGVSAAWQYASVNILLLLGLGSLVLGGWAPFVVIALITVFGSFADELAGDDWDSLSDSATFFNINLYLSLPLICLLTGWLVLFSAEYPSSTAQWFQLIGAIWVVGYLFALVGATVGHELTHRPNRLVQLVAHMLLGFTGNASFASYHVHVHHRKVGTYDDASTARRGERLRTFVARTLVQQFAQAARVEAARLRRRGRPVWSHHNRLFLAHAAPLSILLVAALIGGPFAVFVENSVKRMYYDRYNVWFI